MTVARQKALAAAKSRKANAERHRRHAIGSDFIQAMSEQERTDFARTVAKSAVQEDIRECEAEIRKWSGKLEDKKKLVSTIDSMPVSDLLDLVSGRDMYLLEKAYEEVMKIIATP